MHLKQLGHIKRDILDDVKNPPRGGFFFEKLFALSVLVVIIHL